MLGPDRLLACTVVRLVCVYVSVQVHMLVQGRQNVVQAASTTLESPSKAVGYIPATLHSMV